MGRIYLDNAATTPLCEEAAAAMYEVMQQEFGNPSSIYAEGRAARAIIEQARKTVAQHIGASIGEIFFTSGGTESNNMALKCAVRDLGVERIISSKTEHHCVLHSLERLAQHGKVEVSFLVSDQEGRPDLHHLSTLLKNDPHKKTLVSLMHSNNEIGTMIDLEAVGQVCQENGALFHTDTVQTIGYFPIDINRCHINFLSGSAHKFYGPKGVGFIYINGNNIIKPYVDGGAQERNMRAGTENIYGIVGLAKAMDLAVTNMEERMAHIRMLKKYFADELLQTFHDLKINGAFNTLSHPKVLSVSFPPSPKTELLLLNLDIEGISVSGGSACSSGVDTGSHVIRSLGEAENRKTIRFSFSHLNTKEEIDQVMATLKKLLPEQVVSPV